ncbi:hypothetical protein [Micromonospora craterilacus]|uniref:hypothetical protein n=1 Tax=Micromonospora craterilacus TaxID=1655439 RepID=UPI0011B4431C|nr:hypothetical protein [Micromonospora craterilacus]
MSSSLPAYAGKAVNLAMDAHDLADLLEGDVRITDPETPIATLRAAAIGLGRSIGEVADAAEGRRPGCRVGEAAGCSGLPGRVCTVVGRGRARND